MVQNEMIYMANSLPISFEISRQRLNSKLKDVLKQISLDYVVLETDSPYLAPVPFRGEINSSKNLDIIAKFIADIKNINVLEVAEITSRNASYLFDFNR